ncbi:MAG: hypothetical protein ACRDZU_16365 [Acidimicrobiales bacterium]
MKVALGFKPHTGWAIAVMVAGDASAPIVLDRRKVTLCPAELPRQVYHHAQSLSPARAVRAVVDVEDAVDITTNLVLGELAERSSEHGDLVAVGIVGEPREVPDLKHVLRSHALLHLAEGELYRGALDEAAHARGLAVSLTSHKETIDIASASLGVATDALTATLTRLREHLGAPWQADHRDAAAAALVALALR